MGITVRGGEESGVGVWVMSTYCVQWDGAAADSAAGELVKTDSIQYFTANLNGIRFGIKGKYGGNAIHDNIMSQ